MKCFRVLYKPDDTAFMVWADTEDDAFEKAKTRNISELDTSLDEETEGASRSDYVIDEFTPETNGTGILVFYDVYTVFERKDENGNFIECPNN